MVTKYKRCHLISDYPLSEITAVVWLMHWLFGDLNDGCGISCEITLRWNVIEPS